MVVTKLQSQKGYRYGVLVADHIVEVTGQLESVKMGIHRVVKKKLSQIAYLRKFKINQSLLVVVY